MPTGVGIYIVSQTFRMKILNLVVFLCAAVAALASETKKTSDFFAFEAPAKKAFGLAQAQVLADTQRVAVHGACGMCVFKEKNGLVWVFETKVGYAGIWAADISVVEPAMVLPAFGSEQTKMANQSSQPTPPKGG